MSTVRVNTILAQSGNPVDPVSIPGLDKRFATAWVNFNGTGTVAIRDSYNVASVTDNGTGDYTLNFTTPYSNANYAVVTGVQQAGTGGSTNANFNMTIKVGATPTVNSVSVVTGPPSTGTVVDVPIASVVVFGGKA